MPDLLIELFSEEIPARMQARASDDLRRMVTDGLVEAGLTYAHAMAFATPRRLTLAVEGLTEASRAVREERKGPSTTAPEAAIEGFLRSTGLRREQLQARPDKKGEAFFAVIEKPGRQAAAIVAEVLERVIRDFPWPKSMRWGSGSLRWVRPLQSILCLMVREEGAEVVPLDVDGIVAGDVTRGHRFHAPAEFSVTSFEDYEAKLKRAHVVLRAEERVETIRHDAATLAFARGMEIVADEGLLAEIAGLVEWPVTLMGAIEEQFLALPPEVLRTSMKEHQKFLSVRNPATGRIEGFVTVANIETADQGAVILAGNGRVLRARLSDARFFWERDLAVAKAGMGEWAEGLKSVTFHNKLGSQYERVGRIAALAREIAPSVGADPDLAEKAARVAKLDLRSAMVGEFPELQGLMGRYYAEAAGMAPEVAAAAEEHYSPLGPSDAVPTAAVSVAVALADKIDTLTGFWSIDQPPTGSKDPFALRRAALGVLRLLRTNQVRMSLHESFRSFCRNKAPSRFYGFGLLLEAFSDLSRGYAGQSGEDLLEELEHPFVAFAFHRYAPAREAEVRLLRCNPEKDESCEVLPPQSYFDAVDEIGSVLSAFEPEIEDDPFSLSERGTALHDSLAIAYADELLAFLHDRLKVHLRDQGIPHGVINACLAMPGNDDLTLLVARAEALSAFLKTDDGTNLLQGFKRAANILSQAETKDGVEYSYGAEPKFFERPEEGALFDALARAETVIAPAMQAEDFTTVMTALAGLRGPIDAFFEAVQVNAESQIVRRNRLNLLSRIRTLCLSVADLTKVEG